MRLRGEVLRYDKRVETIVVRAHVFMDDFRVWR